MATIARRRGTLLFPCVDVSLTQYTSAVGGTLFDSIYLLRKARSADLSQLTHKSSTCWPKRVSLNASTTLVVQYHTFRYTSPLTLGMSIGDKFIDVTCNSFCLKFVGTSASASLSALSAVCSGPEGSFLETHGSAADWPRIARVLNWANVMEISSFLLEYSKMQPISRKLRNMMEAPSH